MAKMSKERKAERKASKDFDKKQKAADKAFAKWQDKRKRVWD